MFDFLDRLRQKPPEVRFFITIATAATFTGIVAVVWAVSFASTLSNSNMAAPIESNSLDELRKQFQESVEGGQEIIGSLSELQMGTTSNVVASSTSSATTSSNLDTSLQSSSTPAKKVDLKPSSVPPVESKTDEIDEVSI